LKNKGKGKAVTKPADAREQQNENEQRSPYAAAAHVQEASSSTAQVSQYEQHSPSTAAVTPSQETTSLTAQGAILPQNEMYSPSDTAAKFDVGFINVDATYDNLKRKSPYPLLYSKLI
jgi:hypothetical protein